MSLMTCERGEGIKYISYISYDYHQYLFMLHGVPTVQSIYITKEGRKDCCDLARLQLSWEWRQVKERVGSLFWKLRHWISRSPQRTQIFPEFRTKHFKHFSFRIMAFVHWKYFKYFRWVLILNACLLILNEMQEYFSDLGLAFIHQNSPACPASICFHRWNPVLIIRGKYYWSGLNENSFLIGPLSTSWILKAIGDRPM